MDYIPLFHGTFGSLQLWQLLFLKLRIFYSLRFFFSKSKVPLQTQNQLKPLQLINLFQINAEVSHHLNESNATIQMVSSGGGSSVGPLKLTNDLNQIVDRLPDLVKEMSGVDIRKQ